MISMRVRFSWPLDRLIKLQNKKAARYQRLAESSESCFRPSSPLGFLCYRLLPMEPSAAPSSEVPPAPRVIGRTLRIVVGVAFLYFFVQLIRQAAQILAARSGWSVPRGNGWVGAIL